MNQASTLSEYDNYIYLGQQEGDPASEPFRKGIGLHVKDKNARAICHDGTELHSLPLGDITSTIVNSVTLHSDGSGNMYAYFNNEYIGTINNAPTGTGIVNESSFRFYIKNTLGDCIFRVFSIKYYIEQ